MLAKVSAVCLVLLGAGLLSHQPPPPPCGGCVVRYDPVNNWYVIDEPCPPDNPTCVCPVPSVSPPVPPGPDPIEITKNLNCTKQDEPMLMSDQQAKALGLRRAVIKPMAYASKDILFILEVPFPTKNDARLLLIVPDLQGGGKPTVVLYEIRCREHHVTIRAEQVGPADHNDPSWGIKHVKVQFLKTFDAGAKAVWDPPRKAKTDHDHRFLAKVPKGGSTGPTHWDVKMTVTKL